MDCKIAHADKSGTLHQYLCLTTNQRIDYLAVIVGASGMIMILAALTMVTGAIGEVEITIQMCFL